MTVRLAFFWWWAGSPSLSPEYNILLSTPLTQVIVKCTSGPQMGLAKKIGWGQGSPPWLPAWFLSLKPASPVSGPPECAGFPQLNATWGWGLMVFVPSVLRSCTPPERCRPTGRLSEVHKPRDLPPPTGVGPAESPLGQQPSEKAPQGGIGTEMDSTTPEVTAMFSNQSMENCGGESTTENLIFGCYYILVFFLALNGNCLALWVFSRQRGTSTPANVFLLHLAVADLSYVVIIPLRATYHLTGGHWPFGELPCRLAGFLFYVNMYASLYFLACVAGDRYLAVVHAVRSLKVRRAKYAHFVSFTLWALVAVSMGPLLATRQTSEVAGATVCLQLYREKASRRALVSLAVAFTPPFLATLSCYLLIIHSLRRGSRLEPALKLKALRTIGLVLLIYVVCFLPYHASRAIYILGFAQPAVSCGARRGLMLGNRLTSSLACLNGALDPLVYLFGAEKFRGSLRRLLCREKLGASSATTGELKGTRESSLSAKSEL